MKKFLVVAIILILFAGFVHALTVILVDPPDRTLIRDRINNIPFKCNVSGASEARLFTNVSGIWQQTGTTMYGNDISRDGMANFVAHNVQPGAYEWNCRAIGEQGVVFANTNFTFRFEFPRNDPPTCNGTFPGVAFEKNAPRKTDVLNLYNYFSDPDQDALTFAYSGANNVIVTLKNNGFIDLQPESGRVATDRIYFRASDGRNTEVQCGPLQVTISDTGNSSGGNQSQKQNTPPRITPDIPDQIQDMGVNLWTLNLNNYAEDSEDSKSALNWSVENVDENIVKITINRASQKTTFKPVGIGEVTVMFVVTDTSGLEDTQDVKISILADIVDENKTKEITIPIKIESHTPGSNDPKGSLGETIPFFVNLNTEDAYIIWYVNGVETKNGQNLDNFEFTPDREGMFQIGVVAEKEGETDEYEWKLTVTKGMVAAFTSEDLCGNDIADANETCTTCPEDAGCEEDEQCTPDGCVRQSKVTGFVIGNLPNVGVFGIIGGVVFVILVILIALRTKSKHKDKKLTIFYGKQVGGSKKSDGIEVKKVRDLAEVKETSPGIEPIIGFIQAGLVSGDSEKTIKRALFKSGWGRKEIKLAFKSIKK